MARQTMADAEDAFRRMRSLMEFYDMISELIGNDEAQKVLEASVKFLNVIGPVVQVAAGEVEKPTDLTKYRAL